MLANILRNIFFILFVTKSNFVMPIACSGVTGSIPTLTHDRHLAEELMQDACLAVARRGGPWRISYMITVIRNRHIDICRREAVLKFRSLDDLEAACTAPRSGEIIDEELVAALGKLRPEERELLHLAAVEKYSMSEIAELTDRPRGTVLSSVHRAKHKLRVILSNNSKMQIL